MNGVKSQNCLFLPIHVAIQISLWMLFITRQISCLKIKTKEVFITLMLNRFHYNFTKYIFKQVFNDRNHREIFHRW